MHPATYSTDSNPMFSSKRGDMVTNALLLALDDKSLTPYQSLKAFQKTKKLLIDQGIESKQHPSMLQEAAEQRKYQARRSIMLMNLRRPSTHRGPPVTKVALMPRKPVPFERIGSLPQTEALSDSDSYVMVQDGIEGMFQSMNSNKNRS